MSLVGTPLKVINIPLDGEGSASIDSHFEFSYVSEMTQMMSSRTRHPNHVDPDFGFT